MKMILRKRFRKFIALFLLLVLFVPFIPVALVSADPLPVQVPDFPYGVNAYHSTNTGSFALWQVHGSNYVSYVQTYSSVFDDGFAFPVVLRSGLGWNNLSSYYYYINYEKIIDTWDIYGNHIDGFPGTQNIRIPVPNETTVDSDVYATLVYCTTDIYYGNGYGDDDIYAYQNFIVSSYADPTPTPVPQPAIRGWFDYPELPSNFSADTLCILKAHNAGVNDGALIGIGFTSSNSVFNYPTFYKDRTPWNYRSQALMDYGITINTWSSATWSFSVFSVGYDENTDSYSVTGNLKSGWTNPGDSWFVSSNLDWRGETLSSWSLIPDNPLIVTGQQAGEYSTGSWFEILFTNHNKIPGTSDNPNVSPTPTPTAVPTAIPQPSISPTPTDPPETGDDNNYTGLFGWLKRIRDAILNIPKKIVTGILNALKYIFIPDGNKVKEVYNTLNTKFGIQHPSKFTVDPNELLRPNNVIWKFHPISLNGEDTETTDIILINFEMVDEWLDSSAGMVITRILQAMFGIIMFAYAIYIFTKHIATINYTDAKTIKDLDTSSQKGGSDND